MKEIVRYTDYKQFKSGSRIISVESIDKDKSKDQIEPATRYTPEVNGGGGIHRVLIRTLPQRFGPTIHNPKSGASRSDWF